MALVSKQAGSITLDSTTLSDTIAISEVIPGQSKVRITGVESESGRADASKVQINVNSGTELEVERTAHDDSEIIITWEVEENDAYRVERFEIVNPTSPSEERTTAFAFPFGSSFVVSQGATSEASEFVHSGDTCSESFLIDENTLHVNLQTETRSIAVQVVYYAGSSVQLHQVSNALVSEVNITLSPAVVVAETILYAQTFLDEAFGGNKQWTI